MKNEKLRMKNGKSELSKRGVLLTRRLRTIALFIVTCSLLIVSCDLPESMRGKGTVTIRIGDGGNSSSRAGVNGQGSIDGGIWEGIHISDLTFFVTVKNGPGPDQRKKATYYETVEFTLIPGKWDIFVEAYVAYSEEEEEENYLTAVGSYSVTIKSGSNPAVPIKMEVPPDFHGVYIVEPPSLSKTLSPIESVPFTIAVKGFPTDAQIQLKLVRFRDPYGYAQGENPPGPNRYTDVFKGLDSPIPNGDEIIFNVTATWDDKVDFTYPYVEATFEVTDSDGNEYKGLGNQKLVIIYAGDGYINPIPIKQENIENFIRYLDGDIIADSSDSNWGETFRDRLSYKYILEDDITLTAKWKPIGSVYDGPTAVNSNEYPFTGTFNGQGHTIRGLVIDAPPDDAPDSVHHGLFVHVTGGEIKNLGLVDCNVTGKIRVGGIACTLEEGTIQNCYVTGSLTGVGDAIVGGIVANCVASTISNCYSEADITMQKLETATGVGAGGIVGYLMQGAGSAAVENCYAIGSVNDEDMETTIGGIVGYSNGTTNITVSNCVALNRGLVGKSVGRIIAGGGNYGTNYGLEDMPWEDNEGRTGWTSSLNGIDGENVSEEDSKKRDFWEVDVGFAIAPDVPDDEAINFEDIPWKWSEGKGRPLLWFVKDEE